MTDISLQETATTVKRSRGCPFVKGQSGNPGGRPRGSINQPLYSGGAAVARRCGRALSAADQQRGRCPWRDKGGRRRGRARRHHPCRRLRVVADDRKLPAGRLSKSLASIGLRQLEYAQATTAETLLGIRPVKDLRLSHTPDTAEDSKPTAALPLLLHPVAAPQPRISGAERSRSLYFRCKKQQKQRGVRVSHTIHQAMTHHPSYQIPLHPRKPVPMSKVDPGLRRESAQGTSSWIN